MTSSTLDFWCRPILGEELLWLRKHLNSLALAPASNDHTTAMVSFLRTVRSVRRVGLKEWWRQMQYIGDAKSGRFVGQDQ